MLRQIINIIIIISAASIYIYATPGGIGANLEAWLRADAGVTETNSRVSIWEDQSGNSNHALQNSNQRRPSYVDIDNNEANFNPTIHYTNHFLDIPYNQALNGKNLTIFVVVELDSTDNKYRSPWTTRHSSGSSVKQGHILYRKGSTYRYWNGGTQWHQLTRTTTSGNYEIVTTTSKEKTNGHIDKVLFHQGKELRDASNDMTPNTSKPFRIGKGASETSGGSYPWDGDITEIIIYSDSLTGDKRERVESYLAIKYGITLNQDADTAYKDSDGSIVWDHYTFEHDIAGLARDDTSDLDQRVSRSVHDDAVVTFSTNSDFTSSNTVTSRPSLSVTDKSFIIWSNDNAGSEFIEIGAPVNYHILQRRWKVQKTVDAQENVSIQLDVNNSDFDIEDIDIEDTDFNGKLYLLKGSDLSTSTPLEMTNDGNDKWHIDNINFTDGDLFSFAIKKKMPKMSIAKHSVLISDPANNNNNPKRIPGSIIRYCFTVDNTGEANASQSAVKDILDINLEYKSGGFAVQDIDTECNCSSLDSSTDSSYTDSNRSVVIDIGTITSDTDLSRACAFIEVVIR